VQFVPAGSKIVLDLHRFYQPTKASKVAVGGAPFVQIGFDRATLQLQIMVESPAHGLIDLPVDVSDAKQRIADELTGATASVEHGRMEVTVGPHSAAFFAPARQQCSKSEEARRHRQNLDMRKHVQSAANGSRSRVK
jgi:hypothetical protein